MIAVSYLAPYVALRTRWYQTYVIDNYQPYTTADNDEGPWLDPN